MYLLRLALRPWRASPFSQLFSALAVGVLLILGGFLVWLERGLNPVVQRLDTEQVITAFLDSSVEEREQGKVADSIRVAVGAQRNRDIEVKMVNSTEFVGKLRDHYPELTRELENLGPEMDVLVPRFVTVSGVLPSSSVADIKSLPGVESVESTRDRYRNILGAFVALRWVARFLVAGIALASMTGLLHLARMNGYLHHEALGILRLWGGGGWTLKAPAILSGLSVGSLGGLSAFCAWMAGGPWLAAHVRALSPFLEALPQPGISVGLALLAIGSAIGVLSGVLGGEA